MKTLHIISVTTLLGTAVMLSSCDGKPSPPDSTSAGMQGGTAPVGRENFGQSSGQGVQPQNLGTSPSPPER